jgi:hypothetical protein
MDFAAKRARTEIATFLGAPQVEAQDPPSLRAAWALGQVNVNNWLDALDGDSLSKLLKDLQQSRTTGNVDWIVSTCCKMVAEMTSLEQTEERTFMAKSWVMSQFKKGYVEMMKPHNGGTAKFISILETKIAVRKDRENRDDRMGA